MNLQQLLLREDLDFDELSRYIAYHYNSDKFTHPLTYNRQQVLDVLRSIDIVAPDQPTRFSLSFTKEDVFEDDDDEPAVYADVGCVVTEEGVDKSYDVSLVPWRESLAYDVDESLRCGLDPEEVLAHILAEITFYGVHEDSIDNMIERLRTRQETVKLKDLPMVELDPEDRYIPRSQRDTKEED